MAASETSPRIRLPGELSQSLTYLDDAELRRLRDAVNAEVARRHPVRGGQERGRGSGSTVETGQMPEGKVNLIQASFKAGLSPAAIARNLGIPSALVRRVVKSESR